MILFLTLCQCLTNFENEFISKIKEKKDEVFKKKTTVCELNIDIIKHNVNLYEKYDDKKTYRKLESIVYKEGINEYFYDLEMNNDSEIEQIKRFIKDHTKDKNNFFYLDSLLPDDQIIQFQKNLIYELEKERIFRICTFSKKNENINFYATNCFLSEIKDNKLSVLSFYSANGQSIEKIKIEIDNSDVTKLMKEFFVSYLDEIKNEKHRKFVLDNLFNSKMIFSNINSIEEDVSLLEKCKNFPEVALEGYVRKDKLKNKKRRRTENKMVGSSKRRRTQNETIEESKRSRTQNDDGRSSKKKEINNNITLEEHKEIFKKDLNLKPLLTLFKTSIGTNYFFESIKKILNERETERYYIFKSILRNLKIKLFEFESAFVEKKKYPAPAISKLNEYYAIEISEKIEALKVGNDIANYKSLLLFFYQFIEKDLEDFNFFKSIESFYNITYLEKVRDKVIRKINRYLIPIYRSSLKELEDTVILDFYNDGVILVR